MRPFDVLVLGAGMVGVSTALAARLKGLAVALVDRRGPGEETSYGNSGVVDGGNLFPVAMPRDIASLMKLAANSGAQAHYHLSALPRMARWTLDYWRFSHPEKLEATARLMRPAFAEAVGAHRRFQKIAGAERYFRQTGWLEIYRLPSSLAAQDRRLALSAEFGLDNRRISVGETIELEPHLKPNFAGAIWCAGADTCANPGAATKAYAQAFVARGGLFLTGDATTLEAGPEGYSVMTQEGRIQAARCVIALGPWSGDLVQRFGYSFPLAVKRGYHRHYRPRGNAYLTRQVCDEDVGYVLCPMEQGIRLTSGVEIAMRDAPKTPVQVERAFKASSDLFDLGEPVEAEAWMGARPATPDSRPIIAEAARHKGLWFAFGHGHWGFTLGPATGEAVAAAMMGETPAFDLAPYAAARFG